MGGALRSKKMKISSSSQIDEDIAAVSSSREKRWTSRPQPRVVRLVAEEASVEKGAGIGKNKRTVAPLGDLEFHEEY